MSKIGDIVAKRFPNGLMVGIYGAAPADLLSTKRKGPLRFYRAWVNLDQSQLALIPRFCYTATVMARIMPYPQIEPPERLSKGREQPMVKL